nr:PAS domain-containing protein [uncultured Psychroserpens sp.]
MKHNLSNMMALDIYLSSLSETEYDKISHHIRNESARLPLLSWDIYSENYMGKLKTAKREQDLLKVKQMANQLDWQNDMNDIFDQQRFEAIVITDINQNIIWINDGFTTMTGYSKKEVLHKTPRFLQGPKTSDETKQNISVKLKNDKPFTEVITNYKKDGNSYKCEVKIFPLFNKETTHFIALERQVS